jgi:hypothetical protein
MAYYRVIMYMVVVNVVVWLAACSNETTEAEQQQVDTIGIQDSLLPMDTSITIVDSVEYEYINGVVYLGWNILAMVDFEETFNEELQAYIPYPKFHPPVQTLAGTEVIVEGFVIPLEETGEESIIVLSANPFSSCFFCGGAGPETVMDIQLKPGKKPKLKTDQKVAFKGKLRLNDTDLYYLNYILDDAELVNI